MSKNTDVFMSYLPQHSPQKFTNSDPATNTTGSVASSLKVIATAGTNDSIIRLISATSDDTVAHDVLLFLVDASSNKYLLGAVAVAAGSGSSSATSPVNLLDKTKLTFLPVDIEGNTFLRLKNGWTLQVGLLTQVSAGKTLTINSTSEDF
jgi:hypothetical protein